MNDDQKYSAESEHEARRQRRAEMNHLQLIEGNPLDAEDLAMFEMFDREGWSDERRRAYILDRALGKAAPTAE